METAHTVKKVALAALTAGMTLFWVSAGQADVLTFNQTPASNVVAEMSRRLGVTIVFRGAINANQPVSFSIDDPDSSDGRLQAVSDLANAMGLDFQKTYVVSKIDAGATVPEVKIDSNGPVIFPDTKVPARDAIQMVAAVDDAVVQIGSAVGGDVTLPARRMTAAAAAALIAKQTQTGWKAYYGLFRRGEGPARLEGKVLDRTTLGQPITELPLLTFRSTAVTPTPAPGAPGGLAPGTTPTDPTVTTIPNSSATFFPTLGVNPYGYSPYGANPYAYNPYAYNPYSYGGSYGYNPYGGMGYGGGGYGGGGYGGGGMSSGFDPSSGTGQTPVGGTNVTTIPNGSASVLPDFPFNGSPNGPVFGGY